LNYIQNIRTFFVLSVSPAWNGWNFATIREITPIKNEYVCNIRIKSGMFKWSIKSRI